MKKNQLAPALAAVAALGVVGGIVTAQALSEPRESRSSVELVRPAAEVSTPTTPTTSTSTTPVATATATQEDTVTPKPTSTTTTPAAPAKPKNVDPATIGHEDYAPDDPRRQERPPVAERYNSTGAENGIVVPLPGETAEPRPDSPTPSATTSATP